MSDKQSAAKSNQKEKQIRPEQVQSEVAPELIFPQLGTKPLVLPDHPTTRNIRQQNVLQLQRRYGNRFVQRMLAQNKESTQAGFSGDKQDDAELDGELEEKETATDQRADQREAGGAGISRHIESVYRKEGEKGVKSYLDSRSTDPRFRVGALLGVDLSKVQIHRSLEADDFLEGIAADGAALGSSVYLKSTLSPEERWKLEAHELTHVAQTVANSPVQESEDVATPDSPIEQMAEKTAASVESYRPTKVDQHMPSAAGKVLRGGKGKVIGWVVKVGEKELIKKAAIYTEKQAVKLLGKGYNILVREGNRVAKRIAKKTWGKGAYRESGHYLQKAGKYGKPHYHNPLTHRSPIAAEKGWHLFYSAVPIILFSDTAEATAIYEDKYPGKSVANYLTVTHYVGEDSWLSWLDWINPGELIAIAGDIGRDWDRERTKELKALLFTDKTDNGDIVTYALDPDGNLMYVIAQSKDGKEKSLSAEEYYELIGKAEVKKEKEAIPKDDGTAHPNFAGVFNKEYRIYYSRDRWQYDRETLSYYLPQERAAKLIKYGSYYVNLNPSIDYFYVIVHPKFRAMLRQPGFSVPEEYIWDFAITSKKEDFLDKMFENVKMAKDLKSVDLFKD